MHLSYSSREGECTMITSKQRTLVLVSLIVFPSLILSNDTHERFDLPVAAGNIAAPVAQADIRCFPETHHTVGGLFLQYWTTHGGLNQQGFPLTEEFQEVNKEN